MELSMETNRMSNSHRIQMVNRRSAAFTGVIDVLSFDVAEILLETQEGMLLIKGADLHVNRLTLDKGEVDIEGRVDSLTYSEANAQKSKNESILIRLFQ